ncbi:MAG: threonine/serine exporter family protein [Rhodocyclaceae bacterium]|nr:threonine/serine exporter family protein [Rhodocyclaceae bacterium]
MTTPVDPRITFLIGLGRALHGYGIPAHRLEDALGNAASRLGIRAEFFSGPTSLISSFGEVGAQHTALSRVAPGQLELDRLVELDEVVEALYRGEIELAAADRRLGEIAAAPPRYGPWTTALAFGAAGCAVARFFGGGVAEMVLAGGLGLLTGVIAVLAERRVTVARIFEFLVAALVAFLTVALGTAVFPAAPGPVVVASLIVLLPGLSLTLALNELGTGHLVSGTARFSGAMMAFMKLGIGAAVGGRAATLLVGEAPAALPQPLPGWTVWAALAVTAPALTVLFRARWRELPAIALGTVVAFWGSRLGVAWLGPLLGAAVGALLAGLVANVYARWRRRPAVVLVVPSLIMLVPGSIGYRSLELLMEKDVLSGIDTAFTTILVAVSLVAGLLLANVLVPPRNAL